MCIKKICLNNIKKLRMHRADQDAYDEKYNAYTKTLDALKKVKTQHEAAQADITKTVYLDAGDAAPKQEICRMVVYEDMQPKYIQTCSYFKDCDNADCPHYKKLARYMHVDEQLVVAKIAFERAESVWNKQR